LASRFLHLGVVLVQPHHGIVQLGPKVLHLPVEAIDFVAADERDAGFGKRQGERPPIIDGLVADRGHFLVGRVLGIEQLFAGG